MEGIEFDVLPDPDLLPLLVPLFDPDLPDLLPFPLFDSLYEALDPDLVP